MSMVRQYLFLVFIPVISCETFYSVPNSGNTSEDEYKLMNRVTELERFIGVINDNKQKCDQSINMLTDQIQEVKRYSENRIQKLEKELTSTNNILSKAMEIVAKFEQSSVLKTDANGEAHVRDRRLLFPVTSAPTTVNGVAFSVSMTSHQENLGIRQIIRFDHVITNAGSGFDPVTSVFKAPVSGVYFFTVVIMSHATEDIETQIVKNGTPLVNTYSGDSTTWNQGSQSTVIYLNAGDDVYVHIQDNKGINDGNVRVFGGNWSSFSGFLIAQ